MRAFVQVLLCLCLIPFLLGCGGGNGNGGTTPTRTTPFKATIQWAARSRALDAPSSAISVIFTLEHAHADGSDAIFTINRQAAPAAYTQEYTSPSEIIVGTTLFTARFYANADGQGAVVGIASATVVIQPDGTGLGVLTTQGTIQSVAVEPLTNLLPYRRITPSFSARDAQNNLVAVSPGSAFFTVTAGSENAHIENGELVTTQPGSVTLTATVDGKTSAPITAEVVYRGLALDAAWAKERGDAANTGRGKGQRATGTERWTFFPNGPFNLLLTSPVITADGRAIYSQHTGQVSLIILDMATGQSLGSLNTPGRYSSLVPALGADGTLYLTAVNAISEPGIHAIDSTTGAEKWIFSPQETISSPPTLSPDGRVYASSSSHLYAIDSVTGMEQWKREISNAGMPAIGTDGTVYVTASGTLYALATPDGSTRWQYAYGSAHSLPPVFDVVRNAVYLGDENGVVHAVHAATGQRIWQHTLDSQAVSDLALGTNGKLYAGANSGRVVAYDAATGGEGWTFTQNQAAVRLSLAADGTLYVTASALYALDGQTGAKLWELTGNYQGEPAIAANGMLFLQKIQVDSRTSFLSQSLVGVH